MWWTRGLDLDLDAHVTCTETSCNGHHITADRALVAGVEARDRDRHLVADHQARLLALADAELRLGQHLGLAR